MPGVISYTSPGLLNLKRNPSPAPVIQAMAMRGPEVNWMHLIREELSHWSKVQGGRRQTACMWGGNPAYVEERRASGNSLESWLHWIAFLMETFWFSGLRKINSCLPFPGLFLTWTGCLQVLVCEPKAMPLSLNSQPQVLHPCILSLSLLPPFCLP